MHVVNRRFRMVLNYNAFLPNVLISLLFIGSVKAYASDISSHDSRFKIYSNKYLEVFAILEETVDLSESKERIWRATQILNKDDSKISFSELNDLLRLGFKNKFGRFLIDLVGTRAVRLTSYQIRKTYMSFAEHLKSRRKAPRLLFSLIKELFKNKNHNLSQIDAIAIIKWSIRKGFFENTPNGAMHLAHFTNLEPLRSQLFTHSAYLELNRFIKSQFKPPRRGRAIMTHNNYTSIKLPPILLIGLTLPRLDLEFSISANNELVYHVRHTPTSVELNKSWTKRQKILLKFLYNKNFDALASRIRNGEDLVEATRLATQLFYIPWEGMVSLLKYLHLSKPVSRAELTEFATLGVVATWNLPNSRIDNEANLRMMLSLDRSLPNSEELGDIGRVDLLRHATYADYVMPWRAISGTFQFVDQLIKPLSYEETKVVATSSLDAFVSFHSKRDSEIKNFNDIDETTRMRFKRHTQSFLDHPKTSSTVTWKEVLKNQ